MVWKLFPPETAAIDSIELGKTSASFATPTGDRLYLPNSLGLLTVATKELQTTSQLRLRGGVQLAVTTPSGNQIFLVGDSTNRVHVLDRYAGKISATIRFPQAVKTVRMDPMGRFLLASPFAGDTAWIVPVSNLKYVRSFTTEWRVDLPQVTWDGTVIAVRDRNVVSLDPVTLEESRSIAGGASDYWHFFAWNGFRPRSPDLIEPVNFPVFVDHNDFEQPRRRQVDIDDSVRAVADAAARADSIARADSARARLPVRGVFTVSFAVLRSDSSAGVMARGIRVRGETARVVAAFIDATPIFRVVLGPYPSREEAELIGRTSGRSYWVYEGPP
jgi:hypothetical protein